MTDLPGASEAGEAAARTRPASVRLEVLRKRADFLRAARAARRVTPGFILQARRRGADEPDGGLIRVGFTCSKKVGNAVRRNRARRRLREIARIELPGLGRPGWDYVLVGRSAETEARPFQALRADLAAALQALHREPARGAP